MNQLYLINFSYTVLTKQMFLLRKEKLKDTFKKNMCSLVLLFLLVYMGWGERVSACWRNTIGWPSSKMTSPDRYTV